MNKHNAKDYKPLVDALIDGKTLEYRDSTTDNWRPMTGEIYFDMPPAHYRIKPSPQYRPWTLEEVPVGKVVKHQLTGNRHVIVAVVLNEERVELGGYGPIAPANL